MTGAVNECFSLDCMVNLPHDLHENRCGSIYCSNEYDYV